MARQAFNEVTRASHELSRRLGPFQLLEQLGEGGMAVVYRARRDCQTGLSRDVVLKAMLPQLTRNRALVQMFEAEARLTAQLRHPNIVCVEDFGVENDMPYLIMEYLDGKNLSELRSRLSKQRQQMPIGVAVAIARDLCRALGYAHDFVGNDGQRVQVIHRDVSPSNVMLQRDGTVKLLDFGVAKLSAIAGEAVTTSLKGKFAYMSPEQVEQKPIDRRCDVFAAGIVLHEMLTGERLFGTRDERETLRRVAAAIAHPPSVRNQHVSAALDAVVLRALSREREGRYDSGVEMAQALDALGIAASRRELAAFLDSATPESRSTEHQIPAGRLTGEPFVDGATDQDIAVPGASAPRLQIIANDDRTPCSETTAPSVVYSGEIEVVEAAVLADFNESADRLTRPVKHSSARTPFVGANPFDELPSTDVYRRPRKAGVHSHVTPVVPDAVSDVAPEPVLELSQAVEPRVSDSDRVAMQPAKAPRGRRWLVLLVGAAFGVIAAIVTVRVKAYQRLRAVQAAHAPAAAAPIAPLLTTTTPAATAVAPAAVVVAPAATALAPASDAQAGVAAGAPVPTVAVRRETELAAPVPAQPKLQGLATVRAPANETVAAVAEPSASKEPSAAKEPSPAKASSSTHQVSSHRSHSTSGGSGHGHGSGATTAPTSVRDGRIVNPFDS